jgi:PAS domain-containing protein
LPAPARLFEDARRARTELERANEQLAANVQVRTAELHESEQQFRQLVAGVVDCAIFMLDVNGFVSSWNAGAERIKGYRAEEIIGQHFSVFYTEEDRAQGRQKLALETARQKGKF